MFENITKEELDNLCENLDQFSSAELLDLCKASNRLYPLNEMAYSRGQYIGLCGNLCKQIHYNLVNLIILGSYDTFYEYIPHWKSELMSYIMRLYDRTVDKSVKKYKEIYTYIIDTYVDEFTLQYDSTDIIIDALKDEARKGESNSKYKLQVTFIKKNIIPNIDNILTNKNYIFAELFDALIKTFKNNNMSIFRNKLDEYTTK